MSVTIKDIARQLNLNYSSVSRGLNNKPGVSDKTRRAIVETAEALGYRPNQIARGLVNRTTGTIGVIIPEITNPFYSDVTKGILETANTHGYDVFVCISNWDPKEEHRYLESFENKQVDGIVYKSTDDSDRQLAASLGRPVVCIESWPKDTHQSSVSTDNHLGGVLAARHLLDLGYTKTAVIGGPKNSSAMAARIEGIRKVFQECNVHLDDNRIISGQYNLESGHALAAELIGRDPTIDSIIAGNDVVAMGILWALAENGIRPGVDVGVVGFDNIEYARLPQIQLTTIQQPRTDIGRIAIDVTVEEIRRVAEGKKIEPRQILLTPELVERATTHRR